MDVFVSFWPLFRISRVFGLIAFDIKHLPLRRIAVKSRRLFCYSSVFYIITVVFLFRELIEEGSSEIKNIKEPIWVTARMIGMATFFICGVEMDTTVLLKTSQLSRALNKINRIIHNWGIAFIRELSSFTFKLLFFNTLSYVLCLIYGLLVNIFYLKADSARMLQVVAFFIFLFLMNLFASQFVTFIHTVGFIYARINKFLVRKSEVYEPKLQNDIKKIRYHDLMIKDCLQLILGAFMWFLLWYIFYMFMIFIHGALYTIRLNFSLINLFLWLAYYGSQTISILFACSSASNQAEKTANYLHELFIDNDDPDLKEEIEIFSLQLLHRKVEFNACGFFKLDFSLLYSMVGAVTTYIIILMQFQGNHNHEYSSCKTNCTNCSLPQ